MNRLVRLTPLAQADVAAAQDDYEAREPGLGNRFVEQVRTTLTRISQNPFQYQVIKGTREHRRAPVHEFPFGIWYRVEPDESVVVACLAHRRDLSPPGHRATSPIAVPSRVRCLRAGRTSGGIRRDFGGAARI